MDHHETKRRYDDYAKPRPRPWDPVTNRPSAGCFAWPVLVLALSALLLWSRN